MSGLLKGENEIHSFGLKMYQLIKEKMGKNEDDKYIDNFLCYMLTREEWIKLSKKWRMDRHQYEKPVSKEKDPFKFLAWIGTIEDKEDSSNWYNEIFVSHFWLKKDRHDTFTQFLFGLSHELIHHLEYVDSYSEGKRVFYPQDSREEFIRKYVDPYMRKYPRGKKRFKKIMKQKEFILKPEPFYMIL